MVSHEASPEALRCSQLVHVQKSLHGAMQKMNSVDNITHEHSLVLSAFCTVGAVNISSHYTIRVPVYGKSLVRLCFETPGYIPSLLYHH